MKRRCAKLYEECRRKAATGYRKGRIRIASRREEHKERKFGVV
ncbi:MAG: hypothetical protein V7K42_15155 [Nostoc sp.]